MSDRFLGTLRVDLAAFTAGFDKNLDRSIKGMKKFGRDIDRQYRKIGRSLTTHVTLPIIAAASATVLSADKIDRAQRDIAVATGATGDALAGLNDDLLKIARETPDSFDTIANAIGVLNTQTGETGRPLRELVETVLAGSRLMGDDASESVSQLGRVLRQFNKDAEDGVEIYARLYENSQKYDVSITKQLDNLRTFGPVLSNANIPLEEQADLFARLESIGVDVSRVMPGINQAIRRFADAGLDAKNSLDIAVDAIANAEDEMSALALATELFGSEGAARLTRGIRSGVIAMDELGSSTETTAEDIRDFERDSRSFGEKMSRIGNRILVSLKPVGDEIIAIIEDAEPMIEGLIVVVGDLVEGFGDLPKPTRNTVVAVAGLLAVIGPATVGLAIMVSSVNSLGIFALQSVKGVVDISGAVLELGKNAASSDSKLIGLSLAATKFAVAAAAGFAVGTFLGTEVKFVEVFGAKIIAAAQVTWVELRRLWNWGIGELRLASVGFVDWILDLIGNNLSGLLDGIAGAIGTVAPSMAASLRAATPGLEAAAQAFWASGGLTQDAIRSQMRGVSEELDRELLFIGNVLEDSLAAIDEKYSDPDRKLGESFAKQIAGYTEPVKQAIDDLVNDITGPTQFISQMQTIRDQISGVMEQIPADRMGEIPNEIDKITGSVEDLLAALDKTDKKTEDTAEKFSDQFGERMLDAVEGWSRGVSSTFADFVVDAEASFDQVLDSFIKMLVQMVVQELIFAPLLNAFGTALGLPSFTDQATGGAWSGGSQINRYATGGVVSSPTFFGMSKPGHMGLMGEAGPEAILPLTRVGGDLGVKAIGAGSNVQVNIIDQRSGGEQVQVSESQGPGGSRQIQILIRDAVREMMGDGSLDRSMNNNYGLRRRAVSR